jgi:tetratricopeptide (TPR) repeat protein
LLQRGRVLRLLGQESEAAAIDKRAEKQEPTSALDFYLSAHEYAARQRFDEALPLAKKACERDQRRPGIWQLLALCHERHGEWDKAARCYAAYLNQQPPGPASIPQRVAALVRRAEALAELKRYDHGVAELSEALDLQPDRPELLFLRGRLRYLVGDSAGAYQDERGVLKVLEKSADARDFWDWTYLAKVQVLHGRLASSRSPAQARELYAQALHSFEQAFRLEPNSVELRLSRGNLLARLGQREALEDARFCEEHDASPRTLFEAACIYAQVPKSPAARARALLLLQEAVRQGYGRALLEEEHRDSRLAALQSDPAFVRLLDAARQLDKVGQAR